MDRDLREARRLQQGFLPPSHHRVGASSLSLRLLACNQVGGDLVGYFDLPQAGIALFSIDVSGHGIASALLTGRLSGLFSRDNLRRNIAFNPDGTVVSPEVVMSRLNDFMLHEMSSDIYFTAVLAYVDGATGRVRFCQAGHPHPLVRRHCGSVEAVGHGGPPVGLLEGATFELETCDLREGDSFLTYSDGLTECADTWGEALEEKGLMSLLQGAGSDTEAAVESIERGLEDHVGFAGYDDDVSMILFRFGAAPDSALAA
jgi:sigma-B regulation protein RsbU (phosphoserine phosphatase)